MYLSGERKIEKAKKIIGKTLVFRNVEISDAEFILELRVDNQKSRFLTRTDPDLQKQIDWLRAYKEKDDQAYFIIEKMDGEKLGVVRIYNQKGILFSWGSWIIKNDAPPHTAIESALMVYKYGLHLGFEGSHFEVRKGNNSVSKFHERFGAEKVAESEIEYFYEIYKERILFSIEKYKRYLPVELIVLNVER